MGNVALEAQPLAMTEPSTRSTLRPKAPAPLGVPHLVVVALAFLVASLVPVVGPQRTAPALADTASGGAASSLPNLPSSILVTVAHGHGIAEADRAAAAAGLRRVGSIGAIGALEYVPRTASAFEDVVAASSRPTATEKADLRAVAAALRADPSIASAQPPVEYHLLDAGPAGPSSTSATARTFATSAPAPNDPYFGSQWGLSAIDALGAWGVSRGSSSISVGIVDTGVDASHPDLAGDVLPGYDFVNGDANTTDDNGHGTHVAGIVAASANNGIGVAGVAAGVKILPVKVMDASGTGYDDTIASGIAWAVDHGARVINLSLGGPDPSPVLDAAISSAFARGVLVTVAAGNEGTSPVDYPAADEPALAVGAIALSDPSATDPNARYTRASFSNTGSALDLVAPGAGIVSTVPGGGYESWSGTSMASPFVAGVAALLFSADAGLTPAEARSYMETTAIDLGTPGRDDDFGNGLVSAGRALAALQAAIANAGASTAPSSPAPSSATASPSPSGSPSSSASPSPGATPTPSPSADTSGPSISLSGLVSGTVLRGTHLVGAQASDPSGVASLILTRDSRTVSSTSASTVGALFRTTTVADGIHRWRATAVDTAGNTSSVGAAVLVSNDHVTSSLVVTGSAPTTALARATVLRVRSPLVARVTAGAGVEVVLRLVDRSDRIIAETMGSRVAWLALPRLAAGRYVVRISLSAASKVRLSVDWYRSG